MLRAKLKKRTEHVREIVCLMINISCESWKYCSMGQSRRRSFLMKIYDHSDFAENEMLYFIVYAAHAAIYSDSIDYIPSYC